MAKKAPTYRGILAEPLPPPPPVGATEQEIAAWNEAFAERLNALRLLYGVDITAQMVGPEVATLNLCLALMAAHVPAFSTLPVRMPYQSKGGRPASSRTEAARKMRETLRLFVREYRNEHPKASDSQVLGKIESGQRGPPEWRGKSHKTLERELLRARKEEEAKRWQEQAPKGLWGLLGMPQKPWEGL